MRSEGSVLLKPKDGALGESDCRGVYGLEGRGWAMDPWIAPLLPRKDLPEVFE